MRQTMRRLLAAATALTLVLSLSFLLSGCGGQTYNITVDDGEKLIERCPSKAEKGERVTVYTMSVTDADFVVSVSGAEDG